MSEHTQLQALTRIPLKLKEGNPNLQRILSPSLVLELMELSIEIPITHTLDNPVVFEMIRATIANAASQGVLDYHNYIHSYTVEERVQRLCEFANVPPYEMRLLQIAALMHDLFHSGDVYRQRTSPETYPDLSNEEYSAVAGDKMLGKYLSLSERVALQGLILATTFCQDKISDLPNPDMFRDYRPYSKGERLLAFADVNVLEGSFVHLLTDAILVFSERGAIERLSNHEVLHDELSSFLRHVEHSLSSIRHDIDNNAYERFHQLLAIRTKQVNGILRAGSAEWLLSERIMSGGFDRGDRE
jgi:hypothetical protein